MTAIWHDEYFRHALAACLFGGGGMAMVGVLLTLMQMPFLGICMSHAALLGAVTGLLLGHAPLTCAMAACALAGCAVAPLAEKAKTSSNVAMSVVFSAVMGLSLILIAMIPGPKTEALNLMWGSLLTITISQVWLLGIMFAGLILFLAFFYKELVAVLFNRELAAAGGIPATLIYYGIILLAGMLVGAALDIIGGLLIFALLINPANTARLLSDRLAVIIPLAAALGVAGCLAGLGLSFVWNLPVGGGVAVFSSAMYFAVFALTATRRSSR